MLNWLVYYNNNNSGWMLEKDSATRFLPRDAMYKLSLCCQRFLSVLLSVCHSHVSERLKILSDFSLILIPHDCSLLMLSGINHFHGNPLRGGTKYTGVGKICNF